MCAREDGSPLDWNVTLLEAGVIPANASCRVTSALVPPPVLLFFLFLCTHHDHALCARATLTA